MGGGTKRGGWLQERGQFISGTTERRGLFQLPLNFTGSDHQRKWDFLRGDYDDFSGRGMSRPGVLSFQDMEDYNQKGKRLHRLGWAIRLWTGCYYIHFHSGWRVPAIGGGEIMSPLLLFTQSPFITNLIYTLSSLTGRDALSHSPRFLGTPFFKGEMPYLTAHGLLRCYSSRARCLISQPTVS